MLINTMEYAALVGLVGIIRLRMRYDRIISWLMFLFFAFLLFDYVHQALFEKNVGFSFLWNKSSLGDILISFNPDISLNRVVIPLFFLSAVTVLNNNIFRFEEKRSIFNSFIILNFIAQSLLFGAENCVQLITSVFVSDILGYLVLKDVDSSHRYVVYNFFADMCLFMVLALACGKLQSLELAQFPLYNEIGHHKDFVAFMITMALFAKMGAALFQSYLLDISKARFQRMSAVNLLFAPLSALLLFLKLYGLLQISDLFMPLFQIESLLTFAVGITGFVIKGHIRKKMVYLNMAFLGLMLQMLQAEGFVWTPLFSCYFITVYFVNLLFFKIYLYQNREDNVDKMINAKEINSLPLKAVFAQFILLSAISFILAWNISIAGKHIAVMAESCLIFITISLILSQIYKSPHSRRLDYLALNRLRLLSFLFNTFIFVLAANVLKAGDIKALVFALIFCLIAVSPFPNRLRLFYAKNALQGEDLSKSLFFYAFVAPLMYLSRTLWLAVDFVFSEKIVTAAITAVKRWAVSLFFKINPKGYISSLLFIALGLLCFAAVFYIRIKP